MTTIKNELTNNQCAQRKRLGDDGRRRLLWRSTRPLLALTLQRHAGRILQRDRLATKRFCHLAQGFFGHGMDWVPTLVGHGSFAGVTNIARLAYCFGNLLFRAAIRSKTEEKEKTKHVAALERDAPMKAEIIAGRYDNVAHLHLHPSISIQHELGFGPSGRAQIFKLFD